MALQAQLVLSIAVHAFHSRSSRGRARSGQVRIVSREFWNGRSGWWEGVTTVAAAGGVRLEMGAEKEEAVAQVVKAICGKPRQV